MCAGFIHKLKRGLIRTAQCCSVFQDCVKHRLNVTFGAADRAQDFGCGGRLCAVHRNFRLKRAQLFCLWLL